MYEVVSLQYVDGKVREAREWAKKILDYLAEKYGCKGHVAHEVTPPHGRGERITWILTYDSMESWAAVTEKLPQDSEWQKLASSGVGLRVGGTLTRTLYRTI